VEEEEKKMIGKSGINKDWVKMKKQELEAGRFKITFPQRGRG